MKHKRFTAVTLILAVSLLLMAFAPLPGVVAQAGPQVDPLDVILKLTLSFGSLVGVAGLVAVVINVLKTFGIVQDGTAQSWSAALNLLAFIALVAFRVFRPDLTTEGLDELAGKIAQIAVYILGFIVQITSSKPLHEMLKASAVPVIGKSYTSPDA